MDEFEAKNYIINKGKDIKTIEELKNLIEEVETKFNYDYGVAPRCIGAVSAVVAKYLSATMGITGFQAGFAMWDFIMSYTKTGNKCGMRLVDYDDMLYPQYDEKFEKTIAKTTWEKIQSEAEKRLEDSPNASPNVIAHWKSIVDGVVPFGYIVKE